MFGRYIKLFAVVTIAFFLTILFVTIGFVAVGVVLVIIGGVMAWRRVKHLFSSGDDIKRNDNDVVIDVEYEIIEKSGDETVEPGSNKNRRG